MKLEACPGCGASFPPRDGPVHAYMLSSPACWAAYGEVLAREYSDPALLGIHRLSVDAYAVQHPGRESRKSIQSVGVHSLLLCLALEHELDPEQANEAILAIGEIKHRFTWLDPPSSLGELTVEHVLAASTADEHVARVRAWARSAWMAWTPHHAQIRQWLQWSNKAQGRRHRHDTA